jgi:hypothetical protein
MRRAPLVACNRLSARAPVTNSRYDAMLMRRGIWYSGLVSCHNRPFYRPTSGIIQINCFKTHPALCHLLLLELIHR